ncbi:MAG: O-antigen ligase family protein [Pseudomonadota bacterium]
MATFFLVVYTVLLLIRPHEWGVVGLAQPPYIRITLLICTVFFLVRKQKNLDLPQTRFMGLFTLSILLSLVFSGWVGSIVVYGQDFIQQSLLPFILLTTLLDTRKKLYVILVIIFITSMIMVLNGYYQTIDPAGIGLVGNLAYQNENYLRINYVGFFNDPNDLGMFLAMALPIVFFLKMKSPKLLKLPFWGAVFAILYGIYLTNSRGTLLATVGLCGYWFWTTYGTKKTIWVSAAALPVLFVVFSRFRTITTEEESAEGRLEAWYEGYQMLLSNPIFGVGNNQFLEYHFRTAHNSFVLAFAELGIVGLFAWCALLTSTMIILLKIAKKTYLPAGINEDDPRYIEAHEESLIAKMFIFVFIAFFGSAFFLSRTYTPPLYFMVGLATSSLARVRSMYPDLGTIFTYKELLKTTMYVAVGGLAGIYLLLKFTL